MSNVGYATLTILPSAKNFRAALNKEVGGDLDAAGREGGHRASKGFGATFIPGFKGILGPAVGVAAGAALGAGIKSGLQTAAFMEQARISFETLLGPGGDVEGLLSSISTFAANTPFELPGLTDNVRALLGAGAAANSVIPTMTALGDTNAALGGSQDKLNSVVRAWTQIMGKGKVSAEEMLQITEAGIPIWAIASRALGKPVGELQKMAANGDLLASDVLPALEAQMGKDYGGSMAKQAKTLAGVWSTVQDTINMAMAQALQPLVPILTTILPPAAQALANAIGWVSDQGVRLGTAVAPSVMAVASAASFLWDVLVRGDFKGGNIFGLEEDSSTVDFLFNVRDAALAVGDTFTRIGQSFMAYFGPIGDQLAASVLPPLQDLGNALSANVGPAFQILSDFVNGLFAAFQPLAVIVATVILPALINLGTAIATGVQPVLAVIGDIVRGSLIPAFQQMATMAAPLFTQLGQTISVVAAQVGPILQGIADVVRNVWGFIGPFVMETLVGMFGNVVGIFSGIFTAIQGVVNLISALFRGDWAGAWDAVVQIVSGAVQAVWNFVQLWIIGRLVDGAGAALGALRGLFGGAWDAIVGVVRGAGSAIQSFVGWLLAGMQGAVSGGLAAVRGIFSGAWSAVTGVVSGALNAIVGAVGGGIGNVVGVIASLPGRAMGAISGLVGQFAGIGGQMIAGLANGIRNAAGMIRDAVAGAIGNVVDFAKSLLGIHSPSRVFMEIGNFTAKGMAIGLTRGAKYVKKASDALIPATPTYTAPVIQGGGVQGAIAQVVAGYGAPTQPQIVQENHFNTPMDEATYAELAARKLLRAGVGR